jgi:PBP1b-binding outer membrane lipoprotein LpoB
MPRRLSGILLLLMLLLAGCEESAIPVDEPADETPIEPQKPIERGYIETH